MDSFGISERQWVEAQVENAKQQAILTMAKLQVSADEAHVHLDLQSLRYFLIFCNFYFIVFAVVIYPSKYNL